jgi:hypothetical protein
VTAEHQAEFGSGHLFQEARWQAWRSARERRRRKTLDAIEAFRRAAIVAVWAKGSGFGGGAAPPALGAHRAFMGYRKACSGRN